MEMIISVVFWGGYSVLLARLTNCIARCTIGHKLAPLAFLTDQTLHSSPLRRFHHADFGVGFPLQSPVAHGFEEGFEGVAFFCELVGLAQ